MVVSGSTLWAVACLLVVQFHAVSKLGVFSMKSIAGVIGLVRVRRAPFWLSLALVLSAAMALIYRDYRGLELLPQTLGAFALTAVSIGVMEELVFRGYLMWLGRFAGSWGAILLCALAHALYKSLLFVQAQDNNILILGLFTFLVGIFLGLARRKSNSLYPCLLFHAIFDLAVYGDGGTPWWVW